MPCARVALSGLADGRGGGPAGRLVVDGPARLRLPARRRAGRRDALPPEVAPGQTLRSRGRHRALRRRGGGLQRTRLHRRRLALELVDSVGPMLPMESSMHPRRCAADFDTLLRGGAPAGASAASAAGTCDRSARTCAGERLRATLRVPSRRQRPSSPTTFRAGRCFPARCCSMRWPGSRCSWHAKRCLRLRGRVDCRRTVSQREDPLLHRAGRDARTRSRPARHRGASALG